MSTVFVDTETTGLSIWHGDRPFSVQFQWDNGKQEYFRFKVDPFTRVVTYDKQLDRVKAVLEEPEINKVFHNVKFDRRMLAAAGVSLLGRVDDTMVAMHCLRSHERLGLKAVCKKYLDIGDTDEKELQKATISSRRIAKKYNWAIADDVQADYWLAPKELCKRYAMLDVERTKALWENIQPLLDEEGVRAIYELEMRLLHVTYALETRGMHIDLSVVKDEVARYTEIRNAALLELEQQAWAGFNPNSYEHVARLLFQQLKLEPINFTERGAPQVDKDTLREYDHPLVIALRNYKAADSAINKFLVPYTRLAVDGVLHPDFQQLGPRTGRYSCKMPNLQNVSRGDTEDDRVVPIAARKPFGPRPGHVWYAYDMDQVEARLVACFSGDETLLAAFRNGEDVHTAMALKIWGDPARRKMAKQVVYATLYGGGRKVIAKRFGISLTSAGRVIRDFHAAAPALKSYGDKLKAEAAEYGFIRTIGGRKVYPDSGRDYALLNYRVQGSAADLIKQAMLRVDTLLPTLSKPAWLVSTVHDELIIETYGELNREDHIAIGNAMSNHGYALPIPLSAQGSIIRKSWAEKEKL